MLRVYTISRVKSPFVARCQTARKNYRAALAGSEWEKVRIEVSVLGNKNSRNFIMKLGSDW